MYQYRGYNITVSKVDSCVYAYKSGKLVFIAHDEPTIENMINDFLDV